MKIEGIELTKFDDGYWASADVQEFHQDSGPLFVLEKGGDRYWRAKIWNGPWCENLAFSHGGNFHHAKKHLARAIREEQHIWS